MRGHQCCFNGATSDRTGTFPPTKHFSSICPLTEARVHQRSSGSGRLRSEFFKIDSEILWVRLSTRFSCHDSKLQQSVIYGLTQCPLRVTDFVTIISNFADRLHPVCKALYSKNF